MLEMAERMKLHKDKFGKERYQSLIQTPRILYSYEIDMSFDRMVLMISEYQSSNGWKLFVRRRSRRRLVPRINEFKSRGPLGSLAAQG